MNKDWFETEQLHFAADDGDIEKIKQLVESGFDINAFDEGMSYTPLHYAVKNENLEAIKVLYRWGRTSTRMTKSKLVKRHWALLRQVARTKLQKY